MTDEIQCELDNPSTVSQLCPHASTDFFDDAPVQVTSAVAYMGDAQMDAEFAYIERMFAECC